MKRGGRGEQGHRGGGKGPGSCTAWPEGSRKVRPGSRLGEDEPEDGGDQDGRPARPALPAPRSSAVALAIG